MTDRVILPDFCFNNQRFLTEPNSESLVIHARVDAFAAGGDLGGGGAVHIQESVKAFFLLPLTLGVQFSLRSRITERTA